MIDLITAYCIAAPIPDLVNGVFESFGGLFIGLSIIKLHREKVVRGVSWMHVTFFSSWGFWNLYFFPHLGQWFSFAGGAVLVTANAAWLLQIFYWNSVNKRRPPIAVVPSFTQTKRYRHSDK